MSELSDIGVKTVSLRPESPKIVVVNQPQPIAPSSPDSFSPHPPAPDNASQKFAKLVDSAAGFVFESALEAIKAGKEYEQLASEERADKVERVRRKRRPSVR